MAFLFLGGIVSKNRYLEIEDFYNRDLRSLLKEWYVQEKMSSYEISEKILKEAGITFADRQLRRWLNKFGFCRTHAQSLRNRVITGRMDFQKRKPMKERFIDYDKRDYGKRGELWAIHLKDLMAATLYTNRSLAAEIGCHEDMVSYWKNKRHKVSQYYQQRILEVFQVAKEEIFSVQKGGEIPRLGQGTSWDVRGKLMGLGWRNFLPNIKAILYKQAEKTIQDIAKALDLEATRPHVSDAFNSKKLVSPRHQAEIARIFKMPVGQLFLDSDMHAVSSIDSSSGKKGRPL